MAAIDISRDNVLARLGNGSRTIWDLGAVFDVYAGHPELNRVVRSLLDDGTVEASDTNLFAATLKVTR
jgi:hypothetical protein